MPGGSAPTGVLVLGAVALSVTLVTAFNAGNTGARTVTADVVTDGSAFLAIYKNGNSVHKNFVSVTSGKLSLAFDTANPDAAGTGINPESSYEFDSVIRIRNNGTKTVNIDITFAGTDSALCQAALTTAEDQSAATYSADPAAVSRTKGSIAYLGLKVLGTGKVSGNSVSCTITLTATD
jgi:hypothetical protein